MTASIASLVTFLVLDAAWLSLVAVELFQRQLGPILRPSPMVGAIAAFYVIYACGLVMLAVHPALVQGSSRGAAWRGAVLGLTAYATFDLTNLAVIERWSLALAVADMAWGVTATTLSALAGYAMGRWTAARRSARAPSAEA